MRTLVLGTAGHIDHGKSALVKALTGTDPDRLKEEQERGITIDIGFAHCEIGDLSVSFVDVPGHERFVRNMLAGATGIDAVLLVVAADESVMPQTREHFAICRLLGVTKGIIALTKSDLATPEMLDATAADVRELVAGSALADAPTVPVSAVTGAGLEDMRAAIARLADGGPAASARDGLARLPIDRAFIVKGFGTVVTGTLVSGSIREGDVLELLPAREPARVRGLHVHGARAQVVAAPNRAAVNLGAVALDAVPRGTTIAAKGSLSVTQHFDARIELLPQARPLRHGARVRVHQGTAAITAVVSIGAIQSGADRSFAAVPVGSRAAFVPAASDAYVRFRLVEPMAITRGDRIILRTIADAMTIGGGVVLDPEPVAGGMRRANTLERFRMLDSGEIQAVSRAWLREAGSAGLSADDLVRRGGATRDAAQAVIDSLIKAGEALACAERFVDATLVATGATRVCEALAAFHRASPHESGMSREALRMQTCARDPEAFFALIVERLRAAGDLKGSDRLASAAHRVLETDQDEMGRRAVEEALRVAYLAPPDEAALATLSSLAKNDYARVLRELIAGGVIVKTGGLLFHRDAIASLVADVRAVSPGPGGIARIDVAWLKTRFGLSRKFAIPLLEYLDRAHVTRRVGDARVVL